MIDSCFLPNTVRQNHDLMKARHQRPQMRPTMLGFVAPGRSDRHVAICGTGDANPPPSPIDVPSAVHINPTVYESAERQGWTFVHDSTSSPIQPSFSVSQIR